MFGRRLHRISLDVPLSAGLEKVRETVAFLQENGERIVAIRIDHVYARICNNDFSAKIVTVRKRRDE